MRFDEKAMASLEAAAHLLPDEAGERTDAWPDAAASRAYYAAYQAAADLAQRRRHSFTAEAAEYYRHDTFPQDAERWGLLDPSDCDDLIWLRDLRVRADYWEDRVSLEEASLALEVAAALVATLIGQECG